MRPRCTSDSRTLLSDHYPAVLLIFGGSGFRRSQKRFLSLLDTYDCGSSGGIQTLGPTANGYVVLRRFPPLEPYATGMLDVGDGHSVYWECCGNHRGQPGLYLHGGPGGGCGQGARRLFDPDRFRVVLFDQRGCGRSRPLASDPDTDLNVNTTAHLIRDIEKLRELHEVDQWTVLGVSWGTTLGLAYAQAHPKCVAGLVLALVTTTSGREVQWITEDVGRIFPREWDRFTAAIPDSHRRLRLVDAYATLLADPDPVVRERAAREWCAWEDAKVGVLAVRRRDRRAHFRILHNTLLVFLFVGVWAGS